MEDSGSRRVRRVLRAAIVAGLAAAVGVVVLGPPPAFDVIEPREGAVLGAEGVEVMVRFTHAERIEPGTFRVLLNGADRTPRLTTAGNGAHGHLHEVLDGENVLRFEVFARRWWLPGVLLEEAREVRFLVRLPQDLHRG